MKNNSVTDRTVYTDYKHEAWVAALNILAVEFLVKTNQPDKYTQYCEKLSALTDDELDILHIDLEINHHITSLGHMLSHGDYDWVKGALFEFLEEI